MIYAIIGLILFIISIYLLSQDVTLSIITIFIGIALMSFGLSYGICQTNYYLTNYKKQSDFYIATIQYGKNTEFEVLLNESQFKFYYENQIGTLSKEEFENSYEIKIKKIDYYIGEHSYEN